MLPDQQITRIATEVAVEDLPRGMIVGVSSEPDTGSDGEPTLRILVVLRDDALAEVTGAHTLRALSDLQDRLRAAGETRFATIEYATEEELATNGSS